MIWRTLFLFEMKKIWKRKIVWVCLFLSFFLILVTVGGSLLGSDNYETFQLDSKYQKELDGRVIDRELLGEMREGYGKVDFSIEKYSATEDYQMYARPYSAIYNYVRQNTGLSGKEAIEKIADEEILRERRLKLREQRWEENLLSEEEKEFWRTQEEKIEYPMIFHYVEGYSVLLSSGYTIGFLAVFMVSICLAGIFSEEHQQKTDQLILSSKYGRKELYWAKFAAGLVSAFLISFLFGLTTWIMAFLFYGVEGFDTTFQVIYAGSSYPICVGEAVFLLYGMILCAGIVMGVVVMVLSEVLRNNVGTLAIAVGIIVLPMMVSVPEKYRVFAQLWSYLPSDIAGVWSCFSPRTVVIFGKVFLAWQVVPLLYAVISGMIAFVGKRIFVKYEISGR